MKDLATLKRAPLASALTAILGTSTTVAYAQDESAMVLEEILVTARKRTESVMDIPANIQAISQDALREIGARGVGDLSRFVPSMNTVDRGSGITDVIFRGASADLGYVVQSTSSVYLDEISLTTQGQQPYVRMVDISRVEALAGPQGTLYGADAQAGTLRIITNKPDASAWEVVLDGSAATGSESEESYEGSLVVNVPLITDKLALRVAAYAGKDGGFIDNVRAGSISGDRKTETTYGRSPSGWGQLDNADVVDDDINDFEVTGVRASLLWNISDNWAATLGYMHQETESGMYNSIVNEQVGDLEVIRYNEEFYDVEFDIASLVIEGDLGFAQLVSATSYYDSESSFTQDVTNYQKSYSAYYCINYDADPSYFPYYYAPPEGGVLFQSGSYCNSPTVEGDFLSAFDEDPSSDRFAQELRLFGTADTFDWLVGVFYEESNYSYEEFFGYPTANIDGRGGANELYQQTVSLDYFETVNEESYPDARLPFYALSSSDFEQIAVFGEVTWRATDRLDLTVGARWFDRETTTDYIQRQPETGPDSGESLGLKGDDNEIAPKVSLAYSLNDNNMIYGLYSVGYRPGGTNRVRGAPAFPQQFDPDEMTNYELGYRGTLVDGSMRIATTLFYMDWKDYQFELTDPASAPCPDGGSIDGVCGQPFQVSVANAGDASILGFNAEFDWSVSDNFTVGFNAQWLDAQVDTDLDINGDGEIQVEKGAPLPNAPDLTGAAWATLTFPVGSADGYARLQWSYTDSRVSQLEPTPFAPDQPYPQFEMDAYDIGDFEVGMSGQTWDVSLFVNNITDERANLGHLSQGGWSQYIASSNVNNISTFWVNRPREYGIRFVKRWGGG